MHWVSMFVWKKYGHAIKGFKIISPQKSFIMITFMNVFVSDRDTGTGALCPKFQNVSNTIFILDQSESIWH